MKILWIFVLLYTDTKAPTILHKNIPPSSTFIPKPVHFNNNIGATNYLTRIDSAGVGVD